MIHFSLNIKACCLYVIWGKKDQIWVKNFCIPKNMHSRTLMPSTSGTKAVTVKLTKKAAVKLSDHTHISGF